MAHAQRHVAGMSMRTFYIVTGVLASLLLIAGIAFAWTRPTAPLNSDPRVGKVLIRDDSCGFLDSCYDSWKVCIGPDLAYYIEGWGKKEIPNAKECRP